MNRIAVELLLTLTFRNALHNPFATTATVFLFHFEHSPFLILVAYLT
jgi:hypothetical protein